MKKKKGRKPNHEFSKIKIGGKKEYPYKSSLRVALSYYSRITGHKFMTRKKDDKVTVWRIEY